MLIGFLRETLEFLTVSGFEASGVVFGISLDFESCMHVILKPIGLYPLLSRNGRVQPSGISLMVLL